MENQNPHQEPIAPDYQFITDQQSPDATRKPHAKKVYVLFGLIFVTVLLVGFGLIFGSTTSKVATNDVSQTEAEAVIQSFLQRISTSADTEAYQMIAQEHRISQKFFTEGTAEPLRQRFELSKCIYKDEQQSGSSVLIVRATCPFKTADNKIVFDFRVIATDKPQIIGMTAVEKL